MTPELIRDAAAPIARALTAVRDQGLRVPTVDVLISYTSTGGVVVRVADRSAAHRDAVVSAFRAAAAECGWGFAVRSDGGLRLDHPVELTQPSH